MNRRDFIRNLFVATAALAVPALALERDDPNVFTLAKLRRVREKLERLQVYPDEGEYFAVYPGPDWTLNLETVHKRVLYRASNALRADGTYDVMVERLASIIPP